MLLNSILSRIFLSQIEQFSCEILIQKQNKRITKNEIVIINKKIFSINLNLFKFFLFWNFIIIRLDKHFLFLKRSSSSSFSKSNVLIRKRKKKQFSHFETIKVEMANFVYCCCCCWWWWWWWPFWFAFSSNWIKIFDVFFFTFE